MNELHLFAGAGGGILGGHLLGHTTVCAVELEEYPRKVLLQRQRDGVLPKFPIWDDVCTFDGKPWRGAVDVICGGFPCQDLSNQGANHGEKLGIDGDRSGLWSEYKRIIGEIRPKLVFAENSPNLRTRGLVTVLKDLAELGYDARWCKLGGCHVGADHRRERIWILAHARSDGLEGWNNGNQEGHGEAAVGSMAGLCEGKIWNDLPTPDSFGIANGMAGRMDRLKAVGNGQIPEVARLAWLTLMAGLQHNEPIDSEGVKND